MEKYRALRYGIAGVTITIKAIERKSAIYARVRSICLGRDSVVGGAADRQKKQGKKEKYAAQHECDSPGTTGNSWSNWQIRNCVSEIPIDW